MSSIAKAYDTKTGIELSSIKVGDSSENPVESWKFNMSEQFPTVISDKVSGEATLDVDFLHKGYTVVTNVVNGKANGKSHILNERKKEVGSLEFVDGVANGPCKLYDNRGRIYFEGFFENGYCEGKGKEYDEEGRIVYDGFFNKGNRMNMKRSEVIKGYWNEMNDRDELVSVCKKDGNGRNNGVCFFYSSGAITRVSEWESGAEVNVLKQFDGRKMEEFVNGVKRYKGEYRDSLKDGFPREGWGEEYDIDGNNLLYSGSFWNGKHHGKGSLYKNGRIVYNGKWINGCRRSRLLVFEIISILLLLAAIAVSFLFNVVLGCIVAVVSIVLVVIWVCRPANRVKISTSRRIDSVSTAPVNNPDSYDKVGEDTTNYYRNKRFEVPSEATLVVTRSEKIRDIGANESSIEVLSNCCNDIDSLDLSGFNRLESIVIGENCFSSVNSFVINGLNQLRVIKVADYSFTTFFRGDTWDIKKAIDNSRIFKVLNCAKLESIEIGCYSFSYYGGGFELKNLPSLEYIKIGQVSNSSHCFVSSSFVVENLPKLEYIELGDSAFTNSLSTVISNLPSLKCIYLGCWALGGMTDDSCSLVMKDLPLLETISTSGDGYNFHNVHNVTLSNIPSVNKANLPNSFYYVKTKSVTNVAPCIMYLL